MSKTKLPFFNPSGRYTDQQVKEIAYKLNGIASKSELGNPVNPSDRFLSKEDVTLLRNWNNKLGSVLRIEQKTKNKRGPNIEQTESGERRI